VPPIRGWIYNSGISNGRGRDPIHGLFRVVSSALKTTFMVGTPAIRPAKTPSASIVTRLGAKTFRACKSARFRNSASHLPPGSFPGVPSVPSCLVCKGSKATPCILNCSR